MTRTALKGKTIAFPFSISLELRMETPRWLPWATSIGSIFFALAVGALVLALVGGDPLNAYVHIFSAAFGNVGVLSDTLVKASPLILTGLACLIAFRARLWNIGAEGQFFLGAFGATFIVQQVFDKNTSPWIFIPTMMVAGIIAGALWGFIPGFLKAKFGVNEIITTLMLNYIAFFWNDYFIYGSWSDHGFQLTPTFPANAWLPRLSDYSALIPDFAGLTLHLGLLFGLIATVGVWYLLTRTRWGYEVRLIGDNPNAAKYAGINIVRSTIFVMMLSGALAGLRVVVQRSVGAYVIAAEPGPDLTLDVDAHLVESSKREALPTYEGYRGYQPLLVSWGETGLVLADEFRDGNVPASKGIKELVDEAYSALPGREDGQRWRVGVRSDSAGERCTSIKWFSVQMQ